MNGASPKQIMAEDYLERLRAAAKEAVECGDATRAGQLSGAIQRLQEWTHSGMPGEIPLPPAGLLSSPAPDADLPAAAARHVGSIEPGTSDSPEIPAAAPAAREERSPSSAARRPAEQTLVPASTPLMAPSGPAPAQSTAPAVEPPGIRHISRSTTPDEPAPPTRVLHGSRGASFRLTKRLGGGNYGEVWRAEVDGDLWLDSREKLAVVAVKTMRPGLTDPEKRIFRSEIEALTSLQGYEKEHDLRLDGTSLVPTVLDYLDEKKAAPHPEFFAQTLALGQPVDELLLERKTLPEPDALRIIAQLNRVFEALHEGLQRSYLDFQPKNVFWNEHTRRIMVVDWNLLSARENKNVPNDLRAAGQLLYRILMGVRAPDAGSKRVLAQPAETWESLSLGVRDILARALHPNPTARYSSAAEFRIDLEELLALWGQPGQELLARARACLPRRVDRTALTPDEQQAVLDAARLVSVAEGQDSQSPLPASARLADVRSQVASWMRGQGYLENGRRLFASNGYTEALQDFEKATEEAWDITAALEAARWIHVVKAVLGSRTYTQLDPELARQGLIALGEGRYEAAEKSLQPLHERPGAETLKYLLAEAQARLWLRKAAQLEQERQFEAAAQACRQAQAGLADFPPSYARLLREDLGDLSKLAQDLDQREAQRQAAAALVTRVRAAYRESFERTHEELAHALGEEPGHPDLVELAQELGQVYLQQGQYHQARAVTALGLDNAPGDVRLQPTWQVATALAAAWDSWQSGDLLGLQEALRQVATPGKETPPPASDLLRACFDQAEKDKDYFLARFLASLFPNAQQAPLQERMRRLKARMEEDLHAAQVAGDAALVEWLLARLKRYPADEELVDIAEKRVQEYLNKQRYDLASKLAGPVPRLAAMARQAVKGKAQAEIAAAFQSGPEAGINKLQTYLGSDPDADYLLEIARQKVQEYQKAGAYERAWTVTQLSPHLTDLSQQVTVAKLKGEVLGAFQRQHEEGVTKLRTLLHEQPGDETALALAQEQAQAYLQRQDYARAYAVADLSPRLDDLAQQAMEAWVTAEFAFTAEAGIARLAAFLPHPRMGEPARRLTKAHAQRFLEARDYGHAAQLAGKELLLAGLARLARTLQEAESHWQQGQWDALRLAVRQAQEEERELGDMAVAGKQPTVTALRVWFDEAERQQDYERAQVATDLLRPALDADRLREYQARLKAIPEIENRDAFRLSRVRKIAHLGTLAGLRDTLGLDKGETPTPRLELGPNLRREILEEMNLSCKELLRFLPQDSDTVKWRGWQDTINRALAALPVQEVVPEEERPQHLKTPDRPEKRTPPGRPGIGAWLAARKRWRWAGLAIVLVAALAAAVLATPLRGLIWPSTTPTVTTAPTPPTQVTASPKPTEPTVPPNPPTVLQFLPDVGTVDVRLNAVLRIEFSQPMSTETVEVTLTPDAGTCTKAWRADNKVLELTCDALAPDTTYTVSLDGQDTQDQELAPVPWAFTTIPPSPPKILAVSPADGETGVSTTIAVTVTFDQPIDPATLSVVIEPLVEFAEPTWTEGRTEVTVALAPLAYGQNYTVLVQAKDTQGEMLGAGDVPNPFGFATVPPPPQVALAFPRAEQLLPVFPWQVLITSTGQASVTLLLEAMTPAPGVSVTLGGHAVPFYTQSLTLAADAALAPEPDGTYALRWTREVNDLRELPNGVYTLRIRVKDGETIPTSFTVDSSLALKFVDPFDQQILLEPYQDSPEKVDPTGKNLLVLGWIKYVEPDGLILTRPGGYGSFNERWCLLEDEAGVRGWTWCQQLELGHRAAEIAAIQSLPAIAFPIPARLYTTGGR